MSKLEMGATRKRRMNEDSESEVSIEDPSEAEEKAPVRITGESADTLAPR